ncbi:hypothetical protein [Moorena sp. SIO3H5]|uniref:hypothetical protein n=1 Tax=Moorena sp. SIO3H5 TaxID=2607834 RepID=UPI0013B98892|nr:hypothetical protein [Moorena sp. SIO3H5]NEO73779.1 hypothetical protein [Moorena sp. SIO3H5]
MLRLKGSREQGAGSRENKIEIEGTSSRMMNALSYQVKEEIIEILLIATPPRTQTRLAYGHATR